MSTSIGQINQAHSASEASPTLFNAIGEGSLSAKQRSDHLSAQIRNVALLGRSLETDPDGVSLRIELPLIPPVSFDPDLFNDPSIPESIDPTMVAALKQHLSRYSAHQSTRNALTRLDDPLWLSTWNSALASIKGTKILFYGSELGAFALRAIHHGAAHARAVEVFASDRRLAAGIVQKNLLKKWHAQYGAAIANWSEEERINSFAEFAGNIDVVGPEEIDPATCDADLLVFPNIDHSLLGTGIVKAVQKLCNTRGDAIRVLPASAKIYAMGIQWKYGASGYDLRPIDRFRWSLYPRPLDAASESWTPVTESVCIGTIDFAHFSPGHLTVELPVSKSGTVDAVVYWFDLDLGATRLSNAPHGAMQCILPAVQHTDGVDVEIGKCLVLDIDLHETRIFFQPRPATSQLRSRSLPSWYVPMLLDGTRNTAYYGALARTLEREPAGLVLDIGAGCGLLSMMAVEAGAENVVGCEVDSALCTTANEVVRCNEMGQQIALINKDCRKLSVPTDLAQRADLAVFELFDCSLIGEGVLHYLDYARKNLLTQHARFVPKAAKLRATIIEYRMDRVWDIDVNLTNPYRYSASFINVDAAKLNYRALTEPFELFTFEFDKSTPEPQQKTFALPAIADGIAGAVLFWFDLQLDEETWISNDPNEGSRLHWKQGLQFLPEVKIDSHSSLPLIVRHDGSSLGFAWQPDGIPRTSLSSLPRFDPRQWQQTQELDLQTKALFEYCRENPDEYRKAAKVAQCIAVDPGAHGIDPIIAQRFAAAFMAD